MGKKASGKKNGKGKKVGFGVVFIAACFAAAYILMEFHGDMLMVGIAAVILLLSSFLFMNALFSDKVQELASQAENMEQSTPSDGTDGEFRLKITKHMKEMESTQKELLEAVKLQNQVMQSQIENLEQEIYMLSEKQMVQTKTVIKYNKENARQLAISERETLEHVLIEIKEAMEQNLKQVVVQNVSAAVPVEAPVAEPSVDELVMAAAAAAEPEIVPSLEEIPEGELFAVEEFPEDEEYSEPDLMALLDSLEDNPAEEAMTGEPVDLSMDIPALDDMEIPDIPALDDMEVPDIPALDDMEVPDIPALDDMEVPDIPALDDMEVPDIPTLEDMEIPTEITESDAFFMPTQDDVELLLENMQEEPEPEPVKAPAPVASDPNAMMTPEDIAKLLESMGV